MFYWYLLALIDLNLVSFSSLIYPSTEVVHRVSTLKRMFIDWVSCVRDFFKSNYKTMLCVVSSHINIQYIYINKSGCTSTFVPVYMCFFIWSLNSWMILHFFLYLQIIASFFASALTPEYRQLNCDLKRWDNCQALRNKSKLLMGEF